MTDIADVVTEELLLLRQKVQAVLAEAPDAAPDAHDAYVSALIGHLFAILLTGLGPGALAIDKTPEGLVNALNTIGKKVSLVAGSLDPTSDYRIQIFRRERGGA